MAFDVTKFIKSILIKEENTFTPKQIEIVPGGSANTKTTITSSQTADITVTTPSQSDTLVGRATTDTLTNKTLTSPTVNSPVISNGSISGTTINNAPIGQSTPAAVAATSLTATSATINGDTVTTNTAIQTLTNKTLTSPSINTATISGGTINNTTIGQSTPAAIAATSLTATSASVNGDTVATLTASQTLTNKTIDASVNTISNITNTNISNTAAISLSKLAALATGKALQTNATTGFIEVSAVTNTELGFLSGVTSSIQTQLNAKITNPMTTGGDLIYGGTAGAPTRLPNGLAGQVLTSNGTTLAPSWTTVSPAFAYTAQTANYSASIGDYVNCTTGTFTVTLPTAVGNSGKSIYIVNSGTGVITVATTSAQTVDGYASASNALKLPVQYSTMQVTSDGANWNIVGRKIAINARARATAANTTAANNPFNFDTIDYDPFSAVTTGTGWKFTAPRTTNYRISFKCFLGGASYNIHVYKNGSILTSIGYHVTNTQGIGITTVSLLKDDFIDIRTPDGTINFSAVSGANLTQTNHIEIESVD